MQFRPRVTSWLIPVCVACCLLVVQADATRAGNGTFITSPDGQGTGLAAAYVAVIGQIVRPGVYELTPSSLGLQELVQMAGGLTTEASGNVRVIRRGRGGFQTFFSPQLKYELISGDTIIFDRRFQSQAQVERSFRETGIARGAGPAAAGPHPTLVQIGLVNLITRPVVLDVPAEYASLHGLLQLLHYPLTPHASIIVMHAGHGQQAVTLPLAQGPIALASGTVLVLDPKTVIPQNIPPLPPVIRAQRANAAQRGTQPGAALSRAQRTREWGTGQTDRDSYSISTADRQTQTAVTPRTLTWGESNSTTKATRESPAAPPLLNLPSPAVPSQPELPDPQQPFSIAAVPSATAVPPVADPAQPLAGLAINEPAPMKPTIADATAPASPFTDRHNEAVSTNSAEAQTKKGSGLSDFAVPVVVTIAALTCIAVWLRGRRTIPIASNYAGKERLAEPAAATPEPGSRFDDSQSRVSRFHAGTVAPQSASTSRPRRSYDVVMPLERTQEDEQPAPRRLDRALAAASRKLKAG